MAVERVVIALVANDIDHEEALTVVSASSNPSKGSFDSPDWMPSDSCLRCRDATDWTTASLTGWEQGSGSVQSIRFPEWARGGPGMLKGALGGGVIGNTTGSGPVIEGSSPSPRAKSGYHPVLLAPSSSGLGRRPLKPVTPVRTRSGLPLPWHVLPAQRRLISWSQGLPRHPSLQHSRPFRKKEATQKVCDYVFYS